MERPRPVDDLAREVGEPTRADACDTAAFCALGRGTAKATMAKGESTASPGPRRVDLLTGQIAGRPRVNLELHGTLREAAQAFANEVRGSFDYSRRGEARRHDRSYAMATVSLAARRRARR